jgi:hypothetical protein
MINRGRLVLLAGLATLLVGAKDKSCSAEVDPGDGSAAGWETGPVPTVATKASPMSCEWLASDNCWKRHMAKAIACSTNVEVGTFAADRHTCSFGEGARWEFEGDVATPGPKETHFPIQNWRTLDAAGKPCLTAKNVGIGRTLIDVQGEALLYESTGLLSYRVTCGDGTTFTNDAPNATPTPENDRVCPSFGGEWLAHRAPGLLVVCEGGLKQCRAELWGGPNGLTNATVCGW